MKKSIFICTLIVTLAIFLFVGYKAAKYYIEPNYTPEIIENSISISRPTDEAEVKVESEPEEEKEYTKNKVGWIRLPGLKIDDPVVQTTDNVFYLSRNEYDENNIWGSYFVNSNNNFITTSTLDRVTTIFGHSNGYDTSPKFAALTLLRDPNRARESRTIILDVENQKTTWEIFSACEFPVTQNYLTANPNDETYAALIKSLTEASYNAYNGVNVSVDDKILILSTCIGNNNTETRFLVCGRLVK